ncbi:MAG: hypothetical protein CME24_20965 [Gemmatimonadetes bacterium]|nr:hypothetical protein [Gemmatimonadota bacterium]
MLVGAAGDRSTEPLRWRRGGTNLIYHAAVFAGSAVFVARRRPGVPPDVGPDRFRPRLIAVGGSVVETSVALWFSVWTGILISRWPVVEAM